MIFNSLTYAAFLPLVLIAYWGLGRRNQNIVLLVASYIFYGWWDWRFLSLLAISTIVDFTIGNALHRSDVDATRRRLVQISVAVNLGLLGVFKYFNFFIDSAGDIVEAFGGSANASSLRLILPVGISFYTFQTMSYSFDIYRRRLEPAERLVDFATYVAFFPQLVAGPIERAHRLLPQIVATRDRPGLDQVQSGLTLIAFGLVKKIAIADMVSPIADRAFSGAETASGSMMVVGIIAFSLQIYGDFSGYTDIARGTSRLLNIELMRNFEQPYLSRNITEFWRRWHISLSTWLRDYLYIPLGGNRRGTVITYRNLMITMLLGGLWHGAGWNFVIWGALHGGALALHRAFGGRSDEGPIRVRDIPRILTTLGFVAFAWIFFRAGSFTEARTVIQHASWFRSPEFTFEFLTVLLAGIAVMGTDLVQRFEFERRISKGTSPVLSGALVGIAVVAIVIAGAGPSAPFIYFQF
ncbi:MAG: MBOAT family protein [Acidimicrobiales bacterium]